MSAPIVATVVAQPVGTPQPFGQKLAEIGANDHTFLAGEAGLYVTQKLELLEMMSGCEQKNRYSIANIPAGTEIPDVPDVAWSKEFKESAGFNPILKGKEEGDCFKRVCCPLFRPFTMAFVDGNNNAFLTLDRPFKCDPCYNPGCITCNTQEMSIKGSSGLLANTTETTGPCCTSGMFAREFTVTDPGGAVMYKLVSNDCNSASGGSNFCAPSCFNATMTIDVYDAAGVLQSPSSIVWPGCNCGGMTDITNMVVNFPEKSTAEQRAGLFNGMMMIEFAVMEMRRQQQKDNGGGAGGAPSESSEMVR